MSAAITPLSELLLERRPSRRPVTVGERERTWSELVEATVGLAGRIRSEGGGRWLVAADSAFDFVAALFGVWHGEGIAVLPPNLQRGTLRDLAEGVAGTVGDDAVRAEGLLHLTPTEPRAGTALAGPLDRERTVVELYTSGSTGSPVPVPKRLAQFEEELLEHQRTWGTVLEGSTALATVSHQHIYGLLFRLLWPLCAGRPFHERTFFHWESLLPAMAASGSCYLVSSPAHLSRLHGLAEHAGAVAACRAIFPSGGPLPSGAAADVIEAFGHAPIEVLGSTETGGVGWRRQARGNEPWQPFRGVELGLDGECLRVRSRFTSLTGADGGFTLGDRGRILEDGRFELLGRADGIVKIAGKRVSLQEIEDRVRSHPDVADAAVLTLEGPADPRIAAVVVLTESGKAGLEARGRPAMNSALRDAFVETLDPVTLPRQFRYVDELPVNPQGKMPVDELRKLFERPRGGEVDRPERIDRAAGEDWLELQLRVPEDLCYLEGHFDELPVVPGVVQVEWVHEVAGELLGHPPAIAGMELVKFHTLLEPGRRFTLRLELDRDRGRIGYSLHDGETRFASGRMVLER